MKMIIRSIGLKLARLFGSKIIDAETGEPLGRALLLPGRGKIHVVGLETPVRPVFMPQKRLTYWKQEIGFTVRAEPDFPRLRRDDQPKDT